MSLVHSRGCAGIEAPLITVEVHLSGGLTSMHLVGLPETAVRESKDRVRAALINSCFKWPQSRITISLAPAELPKTACVVRLLVHLQSLSLIDLTHSRKRFTFIKSFTPGRTSTPLDTSTPAGRTAQIASPTLPGVNPPASITRRSPATRFATFQSAICPLPPYTPAGAASTTYRSAGHNDP